MENGQRKNIGIIYERFSDDYQMEIWQGIEKEIMRLDYNLFSYCCGAVESPPEYSVQANFLYDFVSNNFLDGILFFTAAIANYITPSQLDHFCKRYASIPLVSIGQTIKGFPAILVENTSGMYDVVTHLIKKHKKRKIAFVKGFDNNPEAEARFLAYKRALKDNGIVFDPELVCPGDFTEEAGKNAAAELIEKRQKEFDAVVGVDDCTAIGVLNELHYRGGLVPGQVIVAGFDDIEESRFVTPPLTTVHQPLFELGVKSVQVLEDLLAGRNVEKEIFLPTRMVIRQSCGCIDQAVYDARILHSQDVQDHTISGIDKKGLYTKILRSLTSTSIENAGKRVDMLLNTFYQELTGKDDLLFITTLDHILLDISREDGDVLCWQQALNVLRNEITEQLDDKDLIIKADGIIQQARVLVAENAERKQAYKRFLDKKQSLVIQEIGERLMTTFDFEGLKSVLFESMPLLDIGSAYLFLFDQSGKDKKHVSLKMAYDVKWPVDLEDEQTVFSADDFLENELLQKEYRHTMMILPLFFKTRNHGFIVLEYCSMEGHYYDQLGVLISTALEGAWLMAEIKEQQRLEMERLKSEMEIAKHIQTALLPTIPKLEHYDISAGMYPADDVGGDYYDFFIGADGRYWFVIGDVSGHGLTSGLIMLMAQSSISTAIISFPSIKPEALYSHVNKLLFENIRHRLLSDHFMTLSIIAMTEKDRFTIIGSHMEQFLFRADTSEIEILHSLGLWAGIVADVNHTLVENDFMMGPGDILFLFTDGLIEAMNSRREQFDTERVKRLLINHHNKPLEELKMIFIREVFDFMESQADDITLMLVRRKP